MSSLADSTTAFMSTFNGGEFDRMVSLLSPDAVYVDPAGAEHSGVDAIGASLKSIFDGSLGSVSYDVSSTILDESDQRALVTWTMVMTAADGSVSSVDDAIHRSTDPEPAMKTSSVNGSLTKPSPVPSASAGQSYVTSARQMSLPLPS